MRRHYPHGDWMHITCHSGLTEARSSSGSNAASRSTFAQQKNRWKSMRSVLYRLHTYTQSLTLLCCLCIQPSSGDKERHITSPKAQACKHENGSVLYQAVATAFKFMGLCNWSLTLQPDKSRFASLDWPVMLSPSATPRRRIPWRHLSHCMR